VVNDILDISKLESGKLEIEIIDFDLVATVESAAALMAPKARQKQIDMAVFVEPAARGAYRGDPTRLRQILLNLLNNAIKFTEKGGVSIQVVVKLGHMRTGDAQGAAALRGRRHRHGDGAKRAREAVPEIQPGRQLDDAPLRRHRPGPGDLQAARRAHAWRDRRRPAASARARPSGSKFRSRRSTAHVADRETLPSHFKTLRVLLVDDIEMNLTIMSKQLKAFGMTVTSVMRTASRRWRSSSAPGIAASPRGPASTAHDARHVGGLRGGATRIRAGRRSYASRRPVHDAHLRRRVRA
jgi:hypothetical protein